MFTIHTSCYYITQLVNSLNPHSNTIFIVQTSVSVKRINKFMNGEELDPNNVQHDEKESELNNSLISLHFF